jgi:hypothetical protein
MKGKYQVLALLAAGVLLAVSGVSAAVKATTDDGRRVILNDNGTWQYPKAAVTSNGNKFKRPDQATGEISLLRGKASVFYLKDKWPKLKEPEAGRFELKHRDGDAYAVIVSERIHIPLDSLKTIALKNAKNVAPDAVIVEEQMRVVNGTEMLYLRISGTMQGIALTYMGHYFTNSDGSIQVITFTSDNLLPEYQADLQEFISGLQISK